MPIRELVLSTGHIESYIDVKWLFENEECGHPNTHIIVLKNYLCILFKSEMNFSLRQSLSIFIWSLSSLQQSVDLLRKLSLIVRSPIGSIYMSVAVSAAFEIFRGDVQI